MDSKKRQIELHLIDDPSYALMNQAERLFLWVTQCKADNVGVYRDNPGLTEFYCGGKVDLNSFVLKYNDESERVITLNNGRLWFKDFIRDTWGTISANNNLGLSCYKLLVRHELLTRFISEYPNHINIPSFRDAIIENKKGYSGLPLPLVRPSPGPEIVDSDSNQGQSRLRAGSINISINENISISSVIKSIRELIPKKKIDFPDLVFDAEVESLIEALLRDGVSNPGEYLINAANAFNWVDHNWERFTVGIHNGEEIPF